MQKQYTDTGIAKRLWLYTFLTLSFGAFIAAISQGASSESFLLFLIFLIASALGSLPTLIVFAFTIYRIEWLRIWWKYKILLLIILNLLITLMYGFVAGYLSTSFAYSDDAWKEFFTTTFSVTGVLFACTIAAVVITYKYIKNYFCCTQADSSIHSNQINTYMQHNEQSISSSSSPANKILIKGIITAALILLMLIPMIFIQNLVTEREERQKEVVKEVSGKWAAAQTVTAPYLAIPYIDYSAQTQKMLLILPENLSVKGSITPEERPRSIYKVLLYKSDLTMQGNFLFQLPKDISLSSLQLADAKICIGISDFKGIEQKISINYNNTSIDLKPGLPVHLIDDTGLSASLPLNAGALSNNISFNVNIKLKGSSQLHFTPLSANSNFEITSSWANPSFDGNALPAARTVSDQGFKAKWAFNSANLPFTTVLKNEAIDKKSLAFGVSMVQPADQYAKTMRSVKYAILFIALTFALFFIIELLQQKPVHPVQYVLVGLGLVIFYSLLLSISEFILFDTAYLIAATAIILLITLYAKSHFKSFKAAGIFAALLSVLYAFIFVLIRLEDTALLIGSIGLFIVLALIMYASRKINWYQPSFNKPVTSI